MNVYLYGFMPHRDALAILESAGISTTENHSDADALWVRFDVPMLDGFTTLRYILCAATGTEHIDTPPGVRVLSLRDVPAGELDKVTATAELTIGLMLSLLRKIPEAVESQLWAPVVPAEVKPEREDYIGRDLRGKRVLIVGLGRVGWQVRRILLAFGCAVEVFDPKLNSGNLDEMLPRADIVTVHASLNDSSRGMFNSQRFATMKPGSYFVNTSRGELVDEPILASTLEMGVIAGAAVDFWSHDRTPQNLLITPHIGGCTHEAMAATECMIARRFVEELACSTS